MTLEKEYPGHPDLTGGGETTLHSHTGGGSADLHPFSCIDTTGNQAITTDTHINLSSAVISDSNYSLGSNEITCVAAGIYLVSWSIVYDITNRTGSTRGRCTGWIENDDAGSYAVSPGTYNAVYHREAAGGSGLSHSALVVLTNTNKKLRLVASLTSYTTNIDTVASQVNISILKVG